MSCASKNTSMSFIPTKLVNLMHGFCASQSLVAACELGIFDALHEAPEPQSAKQLSQRLSTDHNATSRLLNVLVNMELLQRHSREDGVDEPSYSNLEEMTKWLISSNTMNLAGTVLFRLKDSYSRLSQLSDAVRKGGLPCAETYNESSHDQAFKTFYSDEKTKYGFLESMRSSSRPGAPVLVSAFDLSRFNTMCDLGGCTGEVAYAACSKYPDMKITVLDLTAVVLCSSHFKPSKKECPNRENVTFLEGDFFRGPLPTADLYVLSRILHGCSSEQVDIILTNVYNSLASGGGLLIGELLLNDDKSGPFYPITFDLLMLINSQNGARKRSGPEYKRLLEKHGFVQIEYKVTGSNSIDAVFATKP